MSGERYKVQISARFLSRSQATPFLTDYVSSEGVFVRTDAPPQVMDLLRIEFRLPPAQSKVVLHGMVTRIVFPNVSDHPPGVEIAFFAKGGEAGRAWDDFFAYIRQQYPVSLSQPIMLAPDATDQVRRAHPRMIPQALIRVQATSERGEETLTVRDVSDGGMFITTQSAFVVGSELRVTLENPRTGATTEVECTVRRRTFGTDGGIGVSFRNMNDERRAILRELVQTEGNAQAVATACEELSTPFFSQLVISSRGGSRRTVAPAAPLEDSWALMDQGWPRV